MPLDAFDKQILDILSREDIALNELSERVHLSISAVHRRVKQLIEQGYIGALQRKLDYQKLGFKLHILLQVSLNKHDSDTFSKFIEQIGDIPEVINAFLITGQSADFLLEVVAKDMDNYSDILLKRMGKIDHVAALHSSFVIKQYPVLNGQALLDHL